MNCDTIYLCLDFLFFNFYWVQYRNVWSLLHFSCLCRKSALILLPVLNSRTHYSGSLGEVEWDTLAVFWRINPVTLRNMTPARHHENSSWQLGLHVYRMISCCKLQDPCITHTSRIPVWCEKGGHSMSREGSLPARVWKASTVQWNLLRLVVLSHHIHSVWVRVSHQEHSFLSVPLFELSTLGD